MQDIPFSDIPRKASLFLSILPPSEAEAIAKEYIQAYSATGVHAEGEDERIYVDCNAVNPQTVKRISKSFEGMRGIKFVDAGIIGGPPREGYDPTFYASSDDASALEKFEGLGQFGMKITGMRGEGAGIGDASALKMSYAVRFSSLRVVECSGFRTRIGAELDVCHTMLFLGHNERIDRSFHHHGSLCVSLIPPPASRPELSTSHRSGHFYDIPSDATYPRPFIAAHASSPTTSTFLLNELNASQPQLLQRLTRSVPDMLPKAYRWVGEMREISEFVRDPTGTGPEGGSATGEGMEHVHEGMACVYERIERAMKESGEDKQVLERFVNDAKEAIERKGK